MWIRSQNRFILINANEIYSTDKGIIRCDTSQSIYVLGVYSSKEKALKVLDTIQSHIERYIEYFEGSAVAGAYYKGEYIFNMPQDSEVEV